MARRRNEGDLNGKMKLVMSNSNDPLAYENTNKLEKKKILKVAHK